eukprot:10662-Pelagomonas_calceolata.AAC.4
MLREAEPAGAVSWAWGYWAGPRHVSFFLVTKHESCNNFVRCTASDPNLGALITVIAWPACQVSGQGVGWATLAK